MDWALFVPATQAVGNVWRIVCEEHRKVESSLQYQLGNFRTISHISRHAAEHAAGRIFAGGDSGCSSPGSTRFISSSRRFIVTIDAATLQMDRHILTKRPQCPVCGIPSVDKPQPLQLQSRKKFFTEDGGHRICSRLRSLNATDIW
jgi:bacteriocin biosynthesis cyclodehydratase domain-containing protein